MNNRVPPLTRLAIVISHPIQYYAPWFVFLTSNLHAHIRVFYLSDVGVTSKMDPGFGQEVRWDIDLLSGYEHCFVPNRATDPGTHHFWGLRNPGLIDALVDWKADAILLFGYRSLSHLRLIFSRRLRHVPLLFRGDSHLLAERRALFPLALKRGALRFLFQRFRAFLSVGQANTEYFRRHGVSKDKIFFAPHAVDQRRFRADPIRTSEEARTWRRGLNIPQSNRVILFAGKFERKKCPDDLLRAFIDANLPETTLLLVGSGALESTLRSVAANHPAVRFAPFQNQSAMSRTYAAADLVVLPSFGGKETWGFAIQEALVCGKPVIVSDHVGCHSDLVKTGRNGLVFPAGDKRALGRALQYAMENEARLKSWGEESEKIVGAYSYGEATTGLKRALNGISCGVSQS